MPVAEGSSIPVELPPLGAFTAEAVSKMSLTHWGVTPYKDINNMGPLELRSQLGYREQRWTVLKRCTPYPFGNLISYEVDRQFVAEVQQSGFSANFNSDTAPKVEYVKYAQDQVAELGEIYGDEGFRVLLPLIGMDDRETVNQIIQAVQPFAYALHEMEYEFTKGADKRIVKSNLSDKDKEKAIEVAAIMRGGAQAAMKMALREYEDLNKSMADAQIGKPGISNPTEFHAWICQQINKPVPRRVNRMDGLGDNEAIAILAKRALREETAADQLAEEIAKREALEQRLATLEKKEKTA